MEVSSGRLPRVQLVVLGNAEDQVVLVVGLVRELDQRDTGNGDKPKPLSATEMHTKDR